MSDAQSGAEGSAIEAPEHLFKITDVLLRDDAVVDFSKAFVRREASAEEPTNSCTTADANSNLKQSISNCISVEAMELAREMDALGLPISFSTSKERNGTKTQKNKGTRVKLSARKDTANRVCGISDIFDQEDITSSNVFHDSTSILSCWRFGEDQSVASHCVLQEEQIKGGDVHSENEPTILLTTILGETGKEQQCDMLTDLTSLTSETTPGESDPVGNAQILWNTVSLDVESWTRNMEDGSSEICQEVHSFDKQYEGKCLEGSYISCHSTNTGNDGGDITTLEPALSSQSCTLMNNHTQGYLDNSTHCESGDWTVVWDAFYSRNYFYNCQTQESTWYPPQGLEHFAFACSTPLYKADAGEAGDNVGSGIACDIIPNEDAHSSLVHADSSEENGHSIECVKQSLEEISSTIDVGSGIACDIIPNEDAHISLVQADSSEENGHSIECVKQSSEEISSTIDDAICISNSGVNRPEHSYKHSKASEDSEEQTSPLLSDVKMCAIEPMLEGGSGGASVNILKYWCQRYLLFSRFDRGIKMDEEGWFSVTPESIARHHASRCGSSTVIDCFTGVGGNAIQFAMRSNHVIAIDIDPQKVDYARHNAAIYGVNDRIDFIRGDFFKLAPYLKGNTVFMSPPWGGPEYSKVERYDILSMLKPHNGRQLFEIGRAIASKVVFFLPRNVNINQLAELSLSVNPPWALEVEKNYVNGRLKAITAYFSEPTLHCKRR